VVSLDDLVHSNSFRCHLHTSSINYSQMSISNMQLLINSFKSINESVETHTYIYIYRANPCVVNESNGFDSTSSG